MRSLPRLVATLLTVVITGVIVLTRRRRGPVGESRIRVPVPAATGEGDRKSRRNQVGVGPIVAVIGVLFAAATFTLRMVDSPDQGVGEDDLSSQEVGVFTDVNGRVGLEVRLTPEAAAAGVEQPEQLFDITVKPGPTATGVVSFEQFSHPDVWQIDVWRPVYLAVLLPNGAELADDNHRLIAVPGMRDVCAYLSVNADVQLAVKAVVHRTLTGATLVTCEIPAVGRLARLAVEIPFRWQDNLRTGAGFSRWTSSIRIADHYSEDGQEPKTIILPFTPRPVELTLDLPANERLAESFPPPSSGGHSDRSWRSDSGADIDYTLENSSGRVWVQPTVDLTLLLAGAMFGLAPACWRKRAPCEH